MTTRDLSRLLATYSITNGHSGPIDAVSLTPLELVKVAGRTTLAGGLYRIHDADSSQVANTMVGDAFPAHADTLFCFGFDWLGRQFATTTAQADQSGGQVLLFEPGTGEALEIPTPFLDFHDIELVDHADAALASEWFDSWHTSVGRDLMFNECAGYAVPLFLGGSDSADNLDITDVEVYWSLTAQLLSGSRGLPEGTPIARVIESNERGFFGRKRRK